MIEKAGTSLLGQDLFQNFSAEFERDKNINVRFYLPRAFLQLHMTFSPLRAEPLVCWPLHHDKI